MQEFIQMAVSQLGIGEDAAKTATGGVLEMVREQASDADFGKLAAEVPGLTDMLGAAGSGGGGGGGIGGLMGAAAGMLGGKAGGALGLMSVLQSSGLSMDQGKAFVPMLFGFLKDKAGAGLVGTVLSQAPELKKFLG